MDTQVKLDEIIKLHYDTFDDGLEKPSKFYTAISRFIEEYEGRAIKSIWYAIKNRLYTNQVLSKILIWVGLMSSGDYYGRLRLLIDSLQSPFAPIRNAAAFGLRYMNPHPKIKTNLYIALQKETSIIVRESIESAYQAVERRLDELKIVKDVEVDALFRASTAWEIRYANGTTERGITTISV